jgi:exopolyphosphatase/guanosine-5'-triphosphate,3'-diphosphate pyrophosphatase
LQNTEFLTDNCVRAAIVDCGTNTFNLLVADLKETGPEILHTGKVPVKIGKGGINRSVILPDAMDRAIGALVQHAETIRRFGADKTLVFATSAARSASNKDELIQRAKKEAGLDMTIISGEREAELIYEGVRNSDALNAGNALIMDIGGGSCEFIFCSRDKLFDRFSFEIGVSRLIDRFAPEDPIREDQIAEMYRYLEITLQSMFEKTDMLNPLYLVGSSGTFDTFTEMLKAEKNIGSASPRSSFTYSTDDFTRLYHTILKSTLQERLLIPGMAPFRAEMITASVIAVKCIVDRYAFQKITSSAYSMKEGILFALQRGLI